LLWLLYFMSKFSGIHIFPTVIDLLIPAIHYPLKVYLHGSWVATELVRINASDLYRHNRPHIQFVQFVMKS